MNSKNYQEIEKKLKQEIKAEREKICHMLEDLHLPNYVELHPHEKMGIIDHCSEILVFPDSETAPSEIGLLSLSAEETLELEAKALLDDLFAASSKIEKRSDESQRLLKSIQDMEEIMSSTLDERPMSKTTIETIDRNLKDRFYVEKKKLSEVIACILPEDKKAADLLAEIIRLFFSEGPNKYFQVEVADGMAECIATLERAFLVEVHPTDSFQIRFVDLR